MICHSWPSVLINDPHIMNYTAVTTGPIRTPTGFHRKWNQLENWIIARNRPVAKGEPGRAVPPTPRPSEKNSQGEIVQWPCPTNRSIEWTFYEKLSFHGLFCGPQICQKCTGGTLGELTTLPQTPKSVGEGDSSGHPPPPFLPPQRLRCFDPRAPSGSLVPPLL